MKKSQELADRFRDVFLSGQLVANTNYKHQLSDVTWQQAIQKIGSLNTIALLTFHIDYYTAGVLQVFEGGTLDIRDKYSFDAPPITSKEDWEKRVTELLENAEKFAQHIEKMTDATLESTFVDEKYGSYQKNIAMAIEHCYYHLGQISLIKKMILETENS